MSGCIGDTRWKRVGGDSSCEVSVVEFGALWREVAVSLSATTRSMATSITVFRPYLVELFGALIFVVRET